MNIRLLSILNAASLAIHIALSYLTQMKLVGNRDVGEVSDRYESLFTPAGFTFAIWGVIYILLTAFAVYHIVSAYRKSPEHSSNRDLKRIGYSFIINNIATALWLVAWTGEQLAVSVGLILVQLITLMTIHNRLYIHDATRSLQSRLFTQLPLSVYFGWISLATIANISAWLTSIGWNGWGVSGINWTITMVAIAAMLSVWIINRRRNVFFGLVTIWGLYGIATKRLEISESQFKPIILVAYGAMVLVAIACIFGLIRNLRIRRKEYS